MNSIDSNTDKAERVLSVHNLSKSLGEALLFSSVNFDAEARRSYAIVGESGSGKSTLLHIMAGLESPDSGTVAWLNREVNKQSKAEIARNRLLNVGMIFQAYYLMPHLSAIQNIELPFLLANASVDRARCEYLLESVGLVDKAQSMPRQLSGGEQQRVAIARALAMKPKIILADEPTGSLDQANATRVLEILLTASREAEAALIMVTHSEHIASLANEQWLLAGQQLVRQPTSGA